MIGFPAPEIIGEYRGINLFRLAGGAHGPPCRGQAVDGGATDGAGGDTPVPAAHLGKDTVYVAGQIARIRGSAELGLPAGAHDRHRIRSIFHAEATGSGKAEAQVGVAETTAFDNALLGIIAVQDAIERGEKGIAIAHSGL